MGKYIPIPARLSGWKLRGSVVTVGLTAAALAGGLLSASPAMAATGYDRCPVSRFCIFEHADGQGKYAYFNGDHDNLVNPIGGFVFNDTASSVWNRTKYGFCMWRDINQNNVMAVVRGGTELPFNLPSDLNDQLSSISIGCPSGARQLP